MNAIFSQFSTLELCLIGAAALAFIIQICTWFGFALIATHRHAVRVPKGDPLPEVSVVVVIENHFDFIENGLPLLLDQQYDSEWEVVVVNDCGGAEIQDALQVMSLQYPRLRYTSLRADARFKHSRKIPLLIGIKAARYANIMIADPTACPVSDKWLSLMARGLVGAQFVIGYTGFVQGTNSMIRASHFMTSIRYLRAAVVGNPYRGIYNNIGYTKEVFFKSKGYTHLRLSLGEDDLFVQKIAPYCQAGIILNANATMRQTPYGGLGWWWNEMRYRSYSFRSYPARVKFSIFFELFTKLLFLGSATAVALLPITYIWIYAVGAFLIREFVVVWSIRRVMRRLGERKLLFPFLIYDLLSPLVEVMLNLSRRIKPSGRLWR